MKRSFVFFIFILFSFEWVWSANAVRSFEKRNEFEDNLVKVEAQELAEEISRQQELISAAEKERRKVLGNVYEIRKRLKKVEKEKSILVDKMIHYKANVKEVAKRVVELETLLKEQNKILRERLKSLYKVSGRGVIQILFSTQTPSELDKNLRFFKLITEQDYQLVSSYRKNVQLLVNKKEALQDQVKKLLTYEEKIKSKEGQLEVVHRRKRSYLKDIDKKRNKDIAKLKGIRLKSKKLFEDQDQEDLIQILKTSFFESKGKLPVPVAGDLKQDYGLVTDEELSTRISHKGYFYESLAPIPVFAIADGVIKYKGDIPGFGQTTIIDHGHNYYSVYSNMGEIILSMGDSVKAGSEIGSTGPGGSRFDPGLYFEIRHFSEPLDPGKWLKKRKQRIAKTSTKDGDQL